MACRSVEKAEKAKSEIEASGNIKGSLSTLILEVTKESSIEMAAAEVKQQFGHLDVLINNAGIYVQDANIRTRFMSTFETNVMGPALVAQAFRPLLLDSPNPYSIYVSSGLGSITRTLQPRTDALTLPESVDAYASSKSALNMIAVQEHLNYGSKGLKVFSACPGLVVSNLRGTTEAERQAAGNAGDPMVSGQLLLSIIEGKREADVGNFLHKDGLYGW